MSKPRPVTIDMTNPPPISVTATWGEATPANTITMSREASFAFLADELAAALRNLMPERVGFGASFSWDAYSAALPAARAALAAAEGTA